MTGQDSSIEITEKKSLQTIFDTTPYALLIITDGVFVEANEEALRIFHAKDKSDIIGKPPAILSPSLQPDGQTSDAAASGYINRALAGSHEIFDWQHQTLDGLPFFARVNLKAFDYQGKPSLMVAFEDITSQKEWEAEITVSHQNMQTIFDTTPYALLIITDGVFVKANEAALRIFHAKDKNDIIGKPPAILSPSLQPDGQTSDAAALKHIKKALTGSHEIFEWQHQTLDGLPFFARVNLKAFDYQGKPSLMVAFEDITSQKEWEAEITVSHQNMQTIFDTTPYALLVITEGVFIQANAAALSIFKAHTSGDIIGKPPGILSPPFQPDGRSSDEAARFHIQQAIAGNVESFDFVHKTLTGTLIDCKVTLAGINYNGKNSLMTIIQDATEEKVQQKAILVARQNMETIFDTTPFALLIITEEIFVEANTAAISLFGASKKEDLIGKPPGILSPPLQDNREPSDIASVRHIQNAISGKIESFDWIHQKLNKTPMDCRVTLAGIEYNNKPSLMAIIQDLTEQRRQERQIQQLHKKVDWIIEKNPALMFITDRNLKIQKTNQAWADTSGYTQAQLLTMNLNDFKVFDRTGGSGSDVIQTKTATSGNVRFECPKGTLYLRYFYLPMVQESGVIEEILAVYFDETDLKKLQIQLSESISELGTALARLAAKDLTVIVSLQAGDPLLPVKENLNAAVRDLRVILSDILTDVESLDQSMHEINRSTEDLAKASTDVATTSQFAADEISKQREELDTIGKDVSDLSASIEEIAASAADVRDITVRVAESGSEAQQLGNDATRQMNIVEEISNTAVGQIRDLNNQMQEIGKIIRLISDIANQTNLLALNAAIEAARAGDAGRGFAVVAGEVKSLAGESRIATQNIEDVISRLMEGTTRTAESIEKAYDAIVAGINAVKNTIQGLDQMVQDVEIASGNITEISRATDSQASATNRVNQSIEMVGQMIIGNQEQIDSLAANAEESSATTEEIASASTMIIEMTERLRTKINEFSV